MKALNELFLLSCMTVQMCIINSWNQYSKSDQTMVKFLFWIYFKVVRVLSLRSSVIHGFVTEPWYSRHVLFSCERAALSSAYLVSCWSVVFGSRHSCLEFRFFVGVWTLALHFLSLCDCALSCPRVFCCVAHSSCFYRLRAFMLYLVLCGTQLVYFIGCMLSCCHVLWTCGLWVFSLATCLCLVLHTAGELFAGHVLVFLFCVSMWLLS